MAETAGPEGWAEITPAVCVNSRPVLNDTALEYLCCRQPRPGTQPCFRGSHDKKRKKKQISGTTCGWFFRRLIILSVCLEKPTFIRVRRSMEIERLMPFSSFFCFILQMLSPCGSELLCGSRTKACPHLVLKRETATCHLALKGRRQRSVKL